MPSDGVCMSNKRNVVQINGYGYVPKYNEAQLLKAVIRQPIVVHVNATNLQFYSSVTPPPAPLPFRLLYATASASDLNQFKGWVKKYNKSYSSPTEFGKRFSIYKQNAKLIADLNRKGNGSVVLGLNLFADLTQQEFAARHLAAPTRLDKRSKGNYTTLSGDSAKVPKSVDWRNLMVVGDVKDQGDCGSCWAFAAVSAVESINAMKMNQFVYLSEQELVDCDSSSNGYSGGLAANSIKFISKYGIETEDHYPYSAKDDIFNKT